MTEKSLLSMREIARELNLNYRTMLNYKNQIQHLLPEKTDGQISKYPIECIDLFRLVSALREEGFTFEMIRTALISKNSPAEDSEINEWISLWSDKLGEYDVSGSKLVETDPDEHGVNPIYPDESGLIQIAPDKSDPIQSNTDDPRPARIDSDQTTPSQTNPDQSRPIQADPDLSRLTQTLTNLQAQLTDLTSSLPSDLVPQINAALTQFYKFAMELSARLELLEKELGLELQPMETELDLQSMQIDQDEPVESYVHADLDFVRASIFEGKPDKESVRQWLQRQRQENPSLSYATLAETLNLAGVPTLSGRDTWNRGTLRNLLTDR